MIRPEKQNYKKEALIGGKNKNAPECKRARNFKQISIQLMLITQIISTWI